MIALILLGIVLLVLALCGLLGFVVRLVVAIVASAVLVHLVPALSHQVFASGQIGVSWLFFVTVALFFLTYKVWK